MTLVEYRRNNGAYWRQGSDGVLLRVPLTGKNSSDGLRITWYIQFRANHRRTAAARTSNACRPVGAPRNARNANRNPRNTHFRRRALGKSFTMPGRRCGFLRRFRTMAPWRRAAWPRSLSAIEQQHFHEGAALRRRRTGGAAYQSVARSEYGYQGRVLIVEGA